jgi:hypothetical protein
MSREEIDIVETEKCRCFKGFSRTARIHTRGRSRGAGWDEAEKYVAIAEKRRRPGADQNRGEGFLADANVAAWLERCRQLPPKRRAGVVPRAPRRSRIGRPQRRAA